MAKCPKCGCKLHLYNWRPECPKCHVNMIYYGANERLLADSEAAEIEHAKSQPGVDRAKAAFFGSPKAIIRIILSLIPVGALFLPLWNTVGSDGGKASLNIIGVYKLMNKITFGGLIKNMFAGDAVSVSVIGILLSAVLILVGVICLFMSLGKHGVLRNRIINITKLVAAILSAVLGTVGNIGGEGTVKSSIGIGMILYLILLLAVIIYNEYLTKTGLPIKHTQCLIGGLPSEEYFSLVEQGVSELEIRKKMVVALTAMQDEIRAKAAKAEEEALKKAMQRK